MNYPCDECKAKDHCGECPLIDMTVAIVDSEVTDNDNNRYKDVKNA